MATDKNKGYYNPAEYDPDEEQRQKERHDAEMQNAAPVSKKSATPAVNRPPDKGYYDPRDTDVKEEQRQLDKRQEQREAEAKGTPAANTPAPSTPATTEPAEGSIDWFIQQRDEYRKRHEADEARRKRIDDKRQLIASIGDAGRAIANMVATTQYAPSQDISGTLLSDRYQKLRDKWKADRDKNYDAYMAYLDKGYTGALTRDRLKNDKAKADALEAYRRDEQERKKERDAEQAAGAKEKNDLARDKFEHQKGKDETTSKQKDRQLDIQQQNANTSRSNANARNRDEYKITEISRDDNGDETGRVVQKISGRRQKKTPKYIQQNGGKKPKYAQK